MKKILILLVVLAAVAAMVATFCFAGSLCGKQIKGNGHRVSRTVTLASFSEIKASSGVKVVLVEGTPGQAIIEADENLIDMVEVRIDDDDELVIGIDHELRMVSTMDVTVTVPTDGRLRKIKASSAARVSGEVVLTGTEVSLDTSSAAGIRLNVHADRCEIDASSASKIVSTIKVESCNIDLSSASEVELAGQTTRCDVEVSSAATFAAAECVVTHYNIEVSSAGNADIHCVGTFDATASSGGVIRYLGDGSGEIRTSSGGSVRKH